MRDHESTLKQARTCAQRKYCDIGGNCEYYDAGVCCQGGEKDIMNDAADTIEELLGENADLVEQVKRSQEVIRKLDKLLSAVPQWISVEERLPEFGERVLVCGRIDDFDDEPEYGIDIAYRYHVGVEHIDFYWDSAFDVTHWMPLPEAPKEAAL